MARRRQPPHLLWISDKIDKATGKLRARGYWAIADGPKRISTGLGLEFRADAEKARLDYEVELYSQQSIVEVLSEHGKGVRDVLVVDLIKFWMERKQKKIEAKNKEGLRNYLNMIERLIRFWSGKTVYDINERSIEEYRLKARSGKPLAVSTQLRELAELKSIVNFGIQKGLCDLKGHIIDWELPAQPDPRNSFYTRSEVAKLVWTAYRRKNMSMGRPGVGIHTSKHVARFILIAVKTGTRSEKIETASFDNHDNRPWVDLESGIFYRGGVANKAPNNKKADPVRLPDGLLAHMKRWAKKGPDVIKGSGSMRKAFFKLKYEVFTEERAKKVNRHTFKHTAASWLMRERVPLSIIANYLSTTEEVILKHYGHFSPDFHMEINDAVIAGRREKMAKAAATKKAKAVHSLQEAAE